MTTKRETIMQAIATRLAATAGVTGVHRSREEALQRNESPAVVIAWENEQPNEQQHLSVDKRLSVLVQVYARGLIPDQIADPVMQSAYALLFADPSLGGLVVDTSDEGTELELDEADQTACWMKLRALVWYRHSRADLSA